MELFLLLLASLYFLRIRQKSMLYKLEIPESKET